MSNPVDIRKRKSAITVDGVYMAYRVGHVETLALQGVNICLREGEFGAIMGPSGCGKSTLLHLMGGLQSPTRGSVIIGDTNLAGVSDARRTEIRRDNIGFVFQRYNLLPTLTAYDNIELAKEICGKGDKHGFDPKEILSMMGLEHKSHHKPSELSGGEQQRIAIARAIVNRPKILLADEPTGSLDSENSQAVLELLQELNQRYGQTILMITHDSEVAGAAGRIIEMRDGKVLNKVENLFYAVEQKHQH